ncbi:MAG: acetyl-CoA carboxylase biotin carboxyl carrier protein [bacterium]|nr:acetyl-CoA carboxylase biotin carboxyl carrier protein [bacterium]
MDLKLIRNLVRIMERGEVNELEIDDEKAGLRIHLKRGEGAQGSGGGPVVVMPGAQAPLPHAPIDIDSDADRESRGGGDVDGGLPDNVVEIHSPMVGTLYQASSPEAEPFVGVGSVLEEDTVICIIEAMKVMNEIKAECTGKIVEVLVENGEPVEYGQPLFLVAPR